MQQLFTFFFWLDRFFSVFAFSCPRQHLAVGVSAMSCQCRGCLVPCCEGSDEGICGCPHGRGNKMRRIERRSSSWCDPAGAQSPSNDYQPIRRIDEVGAQSPSECIVRPFTDRPPPLGFDMLDEIMFRNGIFECMYREVYWRARCASTRWCKESLAWLGFAGYHFRPCVDHLWRNLLREIKVMR